MSVVVIVLLAGWFALTVAERWPKTRNRLTKALRAWDVLPALTLFAPEPIDLDFHLVYRDVGSNGALGDWREVPLAVGGPWQFLWNPTLRDHDMLFSAVVNIIRLNSELVPQCRSANRILLVSWPYLLLLQIVMQEERSESSVARQFMIVKTSGFGADRRVALGLASEIHPFE
jgi:hypothetical protein